jgi:mannosyltransferase
VTVAASDLDLPAPASPGPVARRDRRRTVVVVAFGAVLIASVVLRSVTSGPLWLDEAQSVEIARRPLAALFTALRDDGSPPLYYLLLHGWIRLFGDSTIAVRALSTLFAVIGLPLGWLAGRRLGGRQLAAATLLLTATAPWTFRYATETRMYALLFDLVLLGVVLLTRALERPSVGRLVWVGLDTLAIAYTHYWGLYLLAPVAIWLGLRRDWRVLAAMVVATVGYAPWLPSLLFQLRHTGTPWAQRASLTIFTQALLQWGGTGSTGPLLGVLLLGLAAAGLLAVRGAVGDRVTLDLRGLPLGRRLATFTLLPLLLAVATRANYQVRYTAVCLPLYLLLTARGLTRLPRRAAAVAASVVVALGLIGGVRYDLTPRTQAGDVAAVLRQQARPGDVVGYCPDQLAPAVHRLLPASLGLREIAYADPAGPALVDWADYASRVHALTAAQFAAQLLAAAGNEHTVWLVSQTGYRLFTGTCPAVEASLATARGTPTLKVASRSNIFEHESLQRFPGVGQ